MTAKYSSGTEHYTCSVVQASLPTLLSEKLARFSHCLFGFGFVGAVVTGFFAGAAVGAASFFFALFAATVTAHSFAFSTASLIDCPPTTDEPPALPPPPL